MGMKYIYHNEQSSNYTPEKNMKLCPLFEKIKINENKPPKPTTPPQTIISFDSHKCSLMSGVTITFALLLMKSNLL